MSHLRIGLLVTASLLCSAPASGGLFQDLYRGLDVYATPSGSPVSPGPAGGLVNGSRFGRLRIVPMEFGQGYRLELDRNFGADRLGRAEVFEFGSTELELSGGTTATMWYTSRGIPTVNADITLNTVQYSLRGKSGGQNFELRGTLSANNQVEINRLGFYSYRVIVNNADAALSGEGLGVDGDLDADFDIGPITVRGNVFFDAALALMTTLGANTDELESIFPNSPIDRINDEIENALRGQAQVLGETIVVDLEYGTLSSAAAREAQHFVGEVIRAIDDPEAFGSGRDGVHVPEPASLVLVGLLGLLALRRRA